MEDLEKDALIEDIKDTLGDGRKAAESWRLGFIREIEDHIG
jgi:hypothetical protein